jgi:cell division protein FtsI/penicillin-binding protein 2
MAKRLQYKRLTLLGLVLGLAFVGLGYRLIDLQVLRHDELSAKADKQSRRAFLVEPRRGDILDAKGNPLATSLFVKTVCADPTRIGQYQPEIAHAIAPILEMNEGDLIQKLTHRVRQNEGGGMSTNRYVLLKKKVPIETWQRVQTAMTNLTFGLDEKKLSKSEKTFFNDLRRGAIFVERLNDQLRVYPNQSLAAHVLGYVGTDEYEVKGRVMQQTSGREGIEKSFDEKLAGARGWRVTEADHQSRELVASREQDVEPHDGSDVVLTIDSVIQQIVESALSDSMEKHSPVSVSGLVVRPHTGEILAMATLPTFDPNHLDVSTPDQRRNRVITDVAEPGSTFKIVVVSGALNEGIVQLSDVFDCEHSHFLFAGRVLHDHESYGPLSVEKIITKSSNIGAAKIGIKLGPPRLYNYIRSFGFGARSGIPLPSEMAGIVHNWTNWFKVSIAQIPMGQGIAVTRLQMTFAMCAIANKGLLMQPMLVNRLEDRDHRVTAQYTPQRARQVISESAAKTMVTALKTVVSPEGTAPKAALEHYTVAGKTGTAQKFEHGQLAPGKYFASFIGFFPADDPKICISVMMDEPKHGYYGGQTAAPIFKQIAEQVAKYLNILPEDREEQNQPDNFAAPVGNQSVNTAEARSR